MGQQCPCGDTSKGDSSIGEVGAEPVLSEWGEGVLKAAQALPLKSVDGETMVYQSHRRLEPARRRIMATAFPECAQGREVMAVVASDRRGDCREFIAVLDTTGPVPAASLVMGSCQILYEDMSPSECCEYCFAEDPETWVMTKTSCEAIESYKGMKFEAWKGMLTNPTCEAQLRRMLQIGLVTRLYDSNVFPTPDSQKSLYWVIDEKTGQSIELPHPVAGLRVWDASKQTYKSLDPQLTGAPKDEQGKNAFWAGMILGLKARLGDEYVSQFVSN